MITRNIEIVNKLGLHARAASKFVSVTSRFTSKVSVCFNGQTVDGKSIMAIMMLAAGKGKTLGVTFEGDDEVDACEALCELIGNRFDEAE
ncbi:HPr family phosphocarrier protein [Candidatus Sororendozoicomonas aggregata]|uniref:HPr family phosphocarrier protein n=1 Tax=Candidatus Sororendozoicomonas aggregata TaxID=3073239 RepID=UPI002ED35318